MEKKELLSEEKYQNTKGKISKLAIIILAIGLLVGGGLIVTGVVKSNDMKQESVEKVENVDDLQEELDDINTQLAKLKAEQNTEFTTNGFSEKYYTIANQIETLNKRKSELNSEISKINSGWYDNDISASAKTAPYYMFGAFIIISSCMIAFGTFMFSKRREMLAYQMQTVMPVVTEGLEKVAPTVTKVGKDMMKEMAPAYGETAKEISKGIKKGMNEASEEDE